METLELRKALEGLRVLTSIDFASFAILAYDYILTFEDERTLVWPKRWSLLKVLFFLVRYLPFVDLAIIIASQSRLDLSPEVCLTVYKIVCWTINSGIMTAELILLIRTYAIWNNGRFVLALLLAWGVANAISGAVIMYLFTKSMEVMPLPTGLHGCIVSGSNILIGDWILLMTCESVLLVLLVIKGFQLYKQLGKTSLYLALFRDGAIFYICIYAMSVGNVIVISALSHEKSKFCFLAGMERVMHSVLTGRLLFTLQKASVGRSCAGASTLGASPTLQFSESFADRSTTDNGDGIESDTVTSSLYGRLEAGSRARRTF